MWRLLVSQGNSGNNGVSRMAGSVGKFGFAKWIKHWCFVMLGLVGGGMAGEGAGGMNVSAGKQQVVLCRDRRLVDGKSLGCL